MIGNLKDIISGDRMHRNTLIPDILEDFLQRSADAVKNKEVADFSSEYVTTATMVVAKLINFLNYSYSDTLKRAPKRLGKMSNPFLVTKDTLKKDVERMFKILLAHYLIVLMFTNEDLLEKNDIQKQNLENDFYTILDFSSDEKKIFVAMKNDMQRRSEFYIPRLFEYFTGMSAYDDENLMHAMQLGETLNVYHEALNELLKKR